jgi:hypothetical protein
MKVPCATPFLGGCGSADWQKEAVPKKIRAERRRNFREVDIEKINNSII